MLTLTFDLFTSNKMGDRTCRQLHGGYGSDAFDSWQIFATVEWANLCISAPFYTSKLHVKNMLLVGWQKCTVSASKCTKSRLAAGLCPDPLGELTDVRKGGEEWKGRGGEVARTAISTSGRLCLPCIIHLPSLVMICSVVFVLDCWHTHVHTHIRTEWIKALLRRLRRREWLLYIFTKIFIGKLEMRFVERRIYLSDCRATFNLNPA